MRREDMTVTDMLAELYSTPEGRAEAVEVAKCIQTANAAHAMLQGSGMSVREVARASGGRLTARDVEKLCVGNRTFPLSDDDMDNLSVMAELCGFVEPEFTKGEVDYKITVRPRRKGLEG